MSIKNSKNHITGDLMIPRATNETYRTNHDLIFGEPKGNTPTDFSRYDYPEDVGVGGGNKTCPRCRALYWGRRGRRICKHCLSNIHNR